jgi:hypothetical protein
METSRKHSMWHLQFYCFWLIKERKKKLPPKIVNFHFTSDLKIVFPLYSLRRNTFLSSTNDEYNTTFYKEASRKDRAYFLSCRIHGRIMLSCKGPKWTLPITSYYSLELLWCFILRIRVMIFNPRTISIRDSSGTASEMAILLKMLYSAALSNIQSINFNRGN